MRILKRMICEDIGRKPESDVKQYICELGWCSRQELDWRAAMRRGDDNDVCLVCLRWEVEAEWSSVDIEIWSLAVVDVQIYARNISAIRDFLSATNSNAYRTDVGQLNAAVVALKFWQMAMIWRGWWLKAVAVQVGCCFYIYVSFHKAINFSQRIFDCSN